MGGVMSAQRKPRIEDRYKWLVDLLTAEFGDKCSSIAGDYGHMFAVGVTNGKEGEEQRRHACRVEYTYNVGGTYEPSDDDGDPDGGASAIKGGEWKVYALNDAPDKDAQVATMIAKFRKVAEC